MTASDPLAAPSPDPPRPDPAELARQLEEVRRREAHFRLQSIQQFRDLDRELRAVRERAEALSLELGERNTYIHALHGERNDTARHIQELHDDLAMFTHWLATAEAEVGALRQVLLEMENSWTWRYGGWLRCLERWFNPGRARPPLARAAVPPSPPGELVYYLHTTPFRAHPPGAAVLRGWVYGKTDAAITAVRARIDQAEYIGHCGLDEPEAAAVHHLAGGPHARPGFEIPVEFTPGRHQLSLEVQRQHRVWQAFLVTPIWVRP